MDENQTFYEGSSDENYHPDCENKQEPQHWFAGVMIALIVVGLIGNIIVIATILVLQEYKKSITNWYILQLTLANTLFLLMLPFTAHSHITGVWNFSLNLCKFKESMIFINYYASIYFLVIMSFDRYLAVTKAFVSSSWVTVVRSPNFSYAISIFGWVLSVALSAQLFQYSTITKCAVCAYIFPEDKLETNELSRTSYYDDYAANGDTYYYGSGDDHDDNIGVTNDKWNGGTTTGSSNEADDITQDNMPTCVYPQNRTLMIWVLGNFFGAFLLPLLLICFFYGMILRTAFCTNNVTSSNGQKAFRRRITMIVLALVSLFVVSWLPWYVEKLAKFSGFFLSGEQCANLSNAVRILAYTNSVLNPYIYSFLGTHFRERIQKVGSRVGLKSLRSRPSSVSSNKRRHSSTSGSMGQTQKSDKKIYKCGRKKNIACENTVAQFTIAFQTEKTTI